MDPATPAEVVRPPLEEQQKRLAGAWEKRAKSRAGADVYWTDALAGFQPDGLPARDWLRKIAAENAKSRADREWARAIVDVSGNVALSWRWNKHRNEYDCVLGNGLVFEAVDARAAAASAPTNGTGKAV